MSDLNERAAKALGWEWTERGEKGGIFYEAFWTKPDGSTFDFPFEPDKDIAQAWMLVDEVVYKRDMAFWLKQTDKGWWSCKIESWRGHVRHGADTAPLAITRACVKALEAER